MRRLLLAVAGAGLLTGIASLDASAMPTGIQPGADTNPLVDKARVYCYNRYTGRFLHWGYCGRRYARPTYYRPTYYYRRPTGRIYCYNRRTGRFLHWGRC